MEIKKAILYGFLTWLLMGILLILGRPFVSSGIEYATLIKLIALIISTGILGTLYIRNFNKNETYEGFIGGLIFFGIYIVCNLIFIILPNTVNVLSDNYIFDFISSMIIIPLTMTILGYLAEMPIQLK